MSTETPPVNPEEGSPLPAILAGVAILGVAAFLIFGTGGGGGETATENGRAGAGSNQSADQGEAAVANGGRVRGGVQPRSIDDARGRPETRRNPKLGTPIEGMKLDPQPRPSEPPNFTSPEEEIDYFEKKLVREQQILEQRGRFVERVERAKGSAASAQEREIAESRGKIVVDNFAEQQKVVDELEAKLAKLKG